MPSVHWIGKEKVINHHLDVSYRVLEHQYAFENDIETEQVSGSGNKIIHGDNLEALKSLLPEYEGCIRCIYIDPPYNTGNEGWVYNDNVNDPKLKKWLGQVVGRESEDLTRHDKWLCMMYPRLVLLHKLLADDGAIFISIDDNEVSTLRLLMNEIFGSQNFRNHIVVRRGTKSVQAQFENIDKLGIACEYIMVYTKRADVRLPKFYFDLDEAKAGSWNNHWRGTDRQTMRYELLGINPSEGQWRWSKERSLQAWENYKQMLRDLNRVGEEPGQEAIDAWYKQHALDQDREIDLLRLSKNNKPEHYVAPTDRKFGHNLWTDLLVNGTAEFNKYSDEKFDNPKNPQLLERIIGWIAGKHDIILDAFAGSGTTGHAVLNLNKKDGGHRKFILIQMSEYDQQGHEKNICADVTAERIRRVISGYDGHAGTGGSFDYYELGETLFNEDGEINELVGTEKLRQYVYFTETRADLKEHLHNDNPYFLNVFNNTAYYFFYERYNATTLNYGFLSTITTRAQQYVIYADNCLLAKEFLTKHNIVFKKMPRDISRF